MKNGFLIVCLFFCAFDIHAQLPRNFNLVSNGKFTLSPGAAFFDGSFTNSACWIQATRTPILNGASTYGWWDIASQQFHQSVPDSIVNGAVLYNFQTGIIQSTGKIIDTPTTNDRRPYAENRLLEPLVAGKTYHFKMHIPDIRFSNAALAQGAPGIFTLHTVVKNIGVHFSSAQIASPALGRLNLIPQLNFRGWAISKMDTLEFVELSGNYTALGGEQYITIGNFDYYKDNVIATYNFVPGTPDTVRFANTFLRFADVSLVEDTTVPMITLSTFDLGPDRTICPGTPITIGGQPNFFHYQWNTGDTTRLINVSNPGKYWCTVDFGCGHHTDTLDIVGPVSPQGFDLPDTTLCTGVVYAPQAPAGYDRYAWNNGATTPSISIINPGKYWVRIANSCGQTVTDTFSVATAPSVSPGININTIPTTTICEGVPITFITNETDAGTTPAYKWYKNGILIPGATGRNYIGRGLADKDTIQVALYSSETCPVRQPSMSNKMGVTVFPIAPTSVSISVAPSGPVSPGQAIMFTAVDVNGGAMAKYSWMINGRPTPASTGPTFTTTNLRDGDVVSARLESSVPCADPTLVYSNSITINFSTGITMFSNGTLSVYPNPVVDNLIISFREAPKEASFYLFDGIGRIVIQMQQLNGINQQIDLHQIPSGIYTYNIVLDGVMYRGQVLKR